MIGFFNVQVIREIQGRKRVLHWLSHLNFEPVICLDQPLKLELDWIPLTIMHRHIMA